MFLGQGVRSLVGIRRDAFRAGDIHIGAIARLVRFFGYGADGVQLLFRVYEALVSSGNIVVHLDAEDVALLGIADNLVRAVVAQAVALRCVRSESNSVRAGNSWDTAKGCEHQQKNPAATRDGVDTGSLLSGLEIWEVLASFADYFANFAVRV